MMDQMYKTFTNLLKLREKMIEIIQIMFQSSDYIMECMKKNSMINNMAQELREDIDDYKQQLAFLKSDTWLVLEELNYDENYIQWNKGIVVCTFLTLFKNCSFMRIILLRNSGAPNFHYYIHDTESEEQEEQNTLPI